MPLDILKWLGLGGKPKAVRNPHGHTLTHGPSGELVECDTLQCAHCSGHFEVVIGSGRLRGTCMKCGGFVCGAPACMAGCVPFEQRLENIEAGLPVLTPRPLAVSVPADTPSVAVPATAMLAVPVTEPPRVELILPPE